MIQKKHTSSVTNDIITIVLIGIAVLGLSIQFKLYEKFFTFLDDYKRYHVEEIVLTFLTLSLLFAVFSYRRWRELKLEIDEHSKAEQARAETEQRSEALLTTIPNLTFRIRRDGTYMDFRAGNPDDLYDTVDSIIGKKVEERLPKPIAAQYMKHIEHALASNSVQTFEYELTIHNVSKKHQARMIASGTDEVFVLIRNLADSEVVSEALAESETKFRAVVESLSEGLMLTDLNDNVLYMNQRMTELCGWTIDEVKNRPAYSFLLHAEKWNTHVERNKNREEGFAERYEVEVLRKDGSTFWAEVCGSPFRDINKQIIGTIGTFTDITERKWNERLQSALYRITTLTRSAEDTQQLFTTLHQIIGELMYAKNFYIALYDPVSGMISFPYFVDEVDLPPPPRKFSHGSTEYILETGKILHAPQPVFNVMTDRGEVNLIGSQAIDWLGIPLKSGDKTFGVLAIQSYDPKVIFTEREIEILVFVSQHISTAIRQRFEEERFRAVWEHSADGMRVTDKDGCIVMVNEAYCAMVGKTKEELVGRSFLEVYNSEKFHEQKGIADYQKYFVENNVVPRTEAQVFLWNKKDIWVEITTSFVTFGVNERMLLSIFRDITERKRLEDQLLHAQKMDSIGVLAGGIAHDFNNVLAMILGSAELVKHKAKNHPDILKFAQMIVAAAERGSGIAKQLLMFARTEKGKLKPLSVSAVVLDACKLLEHSIPKSVLIRTDFQTGNDVIMGDEDQMHQVIINLAVNARDAIEQCATGSGILTFTVKNEPGDTLLKRFSDATDNLYVALEVSDNGSGMDEQTLRRVFEPFFSTKSRGKGTGLGLSIVHGIMKSHNGMIDVRSTVGTGTTFSLFFPAIHVVEEVTAKTERPADDKRRIPNNSKKVLVVDDEQELVVMIKDILETDGYSVLTANDGIAALAMYKENKHSIGLILSDLGMPNMDGMELLRNVQSDDADIKFIFITGYVDQGLKKDLMESGATDVILKPFRVESVLDSVHQAMPAY